MMALLTPYLNIFNGETVQLEKVPSLDFEEFRETLLMLTEKGGRISSLFGMPSKNGMLRIFAIIARDRQVISVLGEQKEGEQEPSRQDECRY